MKFMFLPLTKFTITSEKAQTWNGFSQMSRFGKVTVPNVECFPNSDFS
jgi:hypothetical protein